jgi:hypothetical protein
VLSIISGKNFSRAKAQSATAFLQGFLCAFAPLREQCFLPGCERMRTFPKILVFLNGRNGKNISVRHSSKTTFKNKLLTFFRP